MAGGPAAARRRLAGLWVESSPVPRRSKTQERIPSAAAESRRAGLGREGLEARPRGIPTAAGPRPPAVATLGLEEGLSDGFGQSRARLAVDAAAMGIPAVERGAGGPAAPGARSTWRPSSRRNLGVEMVGKAASNGAGYTVTDVGDVTGSGYDSFVVAAPGITATGIGGAARLRRRRERRLPGLRVEAGQRQRPSTRLPDAADRRASGPATSATARAQLGPASTRR